MPPTSLFVDDVDYNFDNAVNILKYILSTESDCYMYAAIQLDFRDVEATLPL